MSETSSPVKDLFSSSDPSKRGSEICSSDSKSLGFSSSLVLRDSGDSPKTSSKLVEFTRLKPGESTPQKILLPMFYHEEEAQKKADEEPNTKKSHVITMSTQGNPEIIEEEPHELFSDREKFEYELEVRASNIQNHMPTVVYCTQCGNDCITSVQPERGFRNFLAFLCCCFFAKTLVHRCAECNLIISN